MVAGENLCVFVGVVVVVVVVGLSSLESMPEANDLCCLYTNLGP